MKQDASRLEAMLQAAVASDRAGDLKAAVAGYRRVLSHAPGHPPTLHRLGIACLKQREIAAAMACLRKVAGLAPDKGLVLENLGDGLQAEGRLDDALSMYRRALAAGANATGLVWKSDSVRFAADRLASARPFIRRGELLEYALGEAKVPGLVLEFGVADGGSLRFLSSITGDPVYGFDSFQGLPEAWREGYGAGAFARSEAPKGLPANARLVVGLFEETLPGFRAQHADSVRFAHIDCDLYSSTKTIFDALGDRLVPGTVLVFDEYLNYPEWREHEHRAFMEFVEATGKRFEYLGWTQGSVQVAIRFT